MLKILYASDLHGSDIIFKKLVNAATIHKVNVIIVGGDITGKGIVPIVREKNTYISSIYGTRYVASSQDELKELVKRISNLGFYPYIFEKGEEVKLNDQEYFNQLFTKLSRERLLSWINYAEEKMKDSNVEFFMMPGNDDPYEIDTVFDNSELIINHANKIVDLRNARYELIGNDNSNITPWNCPRDVPEEELKKKLETLLSSVKDLSRTILNTHCPPYGTSLDLAPKLDKDLKPKISGGGLAMDHVGSTSVREVIEKYQPLIGLHGHIHESRGIEKIGKTILMNAGSAYNEGVLLAALIILDENKVRNHIFLKG